MSQAQIDHVLGQMLRGFGSGSTPESRAAVRAEVSEAAEMREQACRLRKAVQYWHPPMSADERADRLGERMQRGDYGRLD